jgi:uncharacterized glyoxalase superfamily protein PhnB
VKRLFAVIRSRGSAWNTSLGLERQVDWDAHAAFMEGLVGDEFVVLGGPLEDTPDVLLVVRATDSPEIVTRLAGDPWVRNGLLIVKQIYPWQLRLGSLTDGMERRAVSHTGPVALCGSATVFVVHDVLRAVEHYRDVLGFHTDFTYGTPTFYAGVERDGVVLHLQAASETKRQPGHGAINIFVSDVDALYRELKSRGARTLNEPKNYPYGMRDFDVHDLDGNHLCFGMESKQQPTG